MNKSVKKSVDDRFSARDFDTNKKVDRLQIEQIVRAGLNAPNGFGFDAWKFLVVEGNKDHLKEAVMNQPAAIDCSFLVVAMYAKKGILVADEMYIERQLDRNKITNDKKNFYLEKSMELFDSNYFKEQLPYATMSMVLQAEELGVKSVIMGGFFEEQVAKLLQIDLNKYGILTITAFGYSKSGKRLFPRVNRSEKETVEFLNF